ALSKGAQRRSLGCTGRRRPGKLILAINSTGNAAARLVMPVPPLAQSLLTLVGMFWVLCAIDLQLALLSLVVVPFLYYSVRYYLRHMQPRLYEVRMMESE